MLVWGWMKSCGPKLFAFVGHVVVVIENAGTKEGVNGLGGGKATASSV